MKILLRIHQTNALWLTLFEDSSEKKKKNLLYQKKNRQIVDRIEIIYGMIWGCQAAYEDEDMQIIRRGWMMENGHGMESYPTRAYFYTRISGIYFV